MIKSVQNIFFFSLLFFSATCNSQEYIDLAKISYAATPAITFDSTESKTTLHEVNGDLTIPLVINDKSTFLTGVSYEMVSASFNPERSIESFTGITLKLGANFKHNSKWSGTYMILPKISSDLKKIAKNDLQLGGVALMKYAKSDHFNYKFGVYTNGERFGQFIVPIFGFYYLNKSEKFEAKVLLPLAVDLNYKLSRKSRFGFSFNGQIRSYNVNTPIGSESERYLTKSANDLYSYLQYEMNNGINVQLGFGRSIARTYRMYNEKVSFGLPLAYFDDNRTQLNTDFSDSWLLKLSIFYRLKFDKNKAEKK